MLLGIDIGNTNIVLGVFDDTRIIHSWRLTTLRERTGDELGLLVEGLFANAQLDRRQVKSAVLARVVPPLTMPAQEMVTRYFGVKVLNVEASINTRMPILYDTPADVGADGIVNATRAIEKSGGAGKQRPVTV